MTVDNYVQQISRVSWGNHLSQYFELSNGVKQGGVLYSILFNIYIDKLLLNLKGSSYGCHINNTFVGALCYADDVTLLSPSIAGLNAKICLCEVFAKNFDITFNLTFNLLSIILPCALVLLMFFLVIFTC